jgi:hypothetical protein
MSDTVLSIVDVVTNLVVEASPSIVAIQDVVIQSVLSDTGTTVAFETVETSIVSEAVQGPAGPPGIAEEEMVYAKRVDWVDENTLYKGEATPGALEDAPVWRIRRLTINEAGDVTEQWAGGNAQFNKVWNDRSQLTYI